MLVNRFVRCVMAVAGACVLGPFATPAEAQFVQQPNTGNANGAMLPGQGVLGQGQNLTPQQLQAMMLMRAMGGRRGGVRTGYPQAIPMGIQGFGDDPVALPGGEGSSVSRKAAAQKKADARKSREEKNRVAKEEAKAKKAKAAKKAAPKQ